MTDDNYEKSTQTHRGRNIKLIGKRNRLNGEIEYVPISLQQGDSSSSESEAESDEEVYGSTDDDEYSDNRDRNVVILDVAKDQARDYSDRFVKPEKSKKHGRKKHRHHGDEGGEGVGGRSRPLGKPPTGRTPRTKQSNAIVEVQQVVELDVVQDAADNGDHIHKLAVPATKSDTMKQVGEGEVNTF